MPDIVITPNRGTTSNPKIDFTGTSAGTIKLEVLADGTISWNGASGSLFSIADSLTGSLMSVNDVSGLPVFEVFSDNKIVAGPYNQNAFVISAGGSIGIGAATPTYKFDIVGADNAIVSRIGSSTRYLTIGSYSPNSGGATLGYNGTQYLGLNAFFGMLVGRTYISNNSTPPADGLAIQGSVGIGQTSPSAKLHIVQNTPTSIGSLPSNVTSILDNNSHNYLLFRNTADNNTYSGLLFQDNNLGAFIAFRNYAGSGSNDGTNGDALYYGTYTDHIFQAGSTETVGGRTEIFRIKQSGKTVFYTGVWHNSSDGYERFHFGGSANTYFKSPNSTFTFRNSSDADIMTLNATGLGIGTASPSYKLHVDGTAYISGVATLGGVSSSTQVTNQTGTIVSYVTPGLYANGVSTGNAIGIISNTSFANNGAWANIALNQTTASANDITAGVHLTIGGWHQNSASGLPIYLGYGYVSEATPTMAIKPANASGGGNVGIGTVTPNAKLTIGTDFATTSGITVDSNNATDSQLILRKAASKTAFSVMAWETQAYIGIGVYYDNGAWVHHNSGTTNQLFAPTPGSGVQWYASNDSSGSWNVASGITLWDDSGAWKSLVQSTRSGNSYFTGGSVGVGTASPLDRLDIAGTTAGNAGRIMFGDGGGYTPYMRFYKWTGTGTTYYQTTISNSISTSGALEFFTGGGGANIGSDTQVLRMSILPTTGSVGIGTTAPAYLLDVNNVGRFSSSSDSQLILRGTDAWAGLTFADSASTDYIWYNGTNATFAIGGGGASVAGKKLHVDGGMSIGSGYDSNTVPSNGLAIQGGIEVADYLELGNSVTRSFAINFVNAVANQAVDIRFPNVYINGYIEITVTSSYSNQNSVGKLTKLFSVGANPNNSIWNTTASRIVEAEGAVADNWTIGDFAWDATNSKYIIPIYHIVSNGNTLNIEIKYYSQNATSEPVLPTTVLSSVYTTTIPAAFSTRHYVYYNDRLGVGITAPTSKLTVAGAIESRANVSDANYAAFLTGLYDSTHALRLGVKINSGTESEILGVFADSGGATPRTIINPSNGWNVAVGTTTVAPEKFTVYGNIASTAGIAANYSGNSSTLGTGLSLWGSPTTTTSLSLFKRYDLLFGRANTAITEGAGSSGYATYHIMDTAGRGWVWRYISSNNTSTGTNVASLRNDTGQMTLGTGYDWSSGYHAQLNISAGQGAATTYRDIDLHGSWAAGEGHAITATHASGASNIVGQIVFYHDGPGSRIRFGRLYHGGDSSAYPMELISLSTSSAYLTVNRDIYATGGASGNFGNRIIVGNTSTPQTLQDTNLRPTIYNYGAYPVITLDHTVTSNGAHGPTIQFAFNGLTTGGSTGRQIVIGAPGDGAYLDVGFSGGAWGTNSNLNPHNGISGYNGLVPLRIFSNGILVGSTGAYGSHITSITNALDVRGTSFLNYGVTTASSVTYGATAGQIFRNENSELAIGLLNASPYPLWIQGRNSSSAARDIVLQPSGGNVGIGNTSPAYKFDVTGDARITSRLTLSGSSGNQLSGNGTNLTLTSNGNWNSGLSSLIELTTTDLNLWTNGGAFNFKDNAGNTKVFITNSGNLGIGASPSYKLHVSGDTYMTGSLYISQVYTSGQPGHLAIGNTGYNYLFTQGTWTSDIRAGILANCSDNWEFAIHDSGQRVVSAFAFFGGSSNNYFQFGRDIGWGVSNAAFAGNVGIGTTNPTQKLHVYGAIRYRSNGSLDVTEYSGTVASADNHPTCDAKARIYTIGTINSSSAYNGYIEVEVIGSHRGYTPSTYREYKKWIITVGDQISSRLVFSDGAENRVGMWNGTDATGWKGASSSHSSSGKVLKLIVNPSCGSGYVYTVKIKYAEVAMTHGDFSYVDHSVQSVTVPYSQFWLNGDSVILGRESGNVGIGDSSLAYKLDVTGEVRSTSNAYFATNGSSNVGIGQTYAFHPLEVASYQSVAAYFGGGITTERNSNGALISTFRNLSAGSSAYSSLYLGNDTAANKLVFFVNSSARSTDGGVGNSTIRTDSGDLLLGAGGVTHHVIKSGGNVGIGNTSPSYKLDVTGDIRSTTGARFATSSGSVAIGTTTASTKLHVGTKVNDDNSYTYDADSTYLVHQTATSSTVLNDPKEVLLLARQGTSGQAFGSAASFRLSRYENSSVNARTRLDLVLAHNSFLTSPTTVMTLRSDGTVGFGTTTPAYKVDVSGDTRITGALAVGNTTPSATPGEIRATNNITAYYSDERLKTKLGNIPNALSKVLSLSGFYYEPNETAQKLGYEKKREIGVSAQEVVAILPEIVAPAPIDDKYLTVRYEKLIPLLIEAIKEQQAEIEKLKKLVIIK